MAKKLKIPGAADDPAKKSKQEELEKAGAAAPMDIQVQEVVNVSAARAAGGEVTVKLEPLAPAGEALAGQVCEVEFEDGIKLWMRVGSLYRDFGRPRTRGAAPAPAEDVWEIAPIAARAPAARGSAREGAIRRVTIYKWEKIPAAVPPIATTSAKPSRRSAKSASRSRRGVVADVLVDAAGELVGEKIMEGIADRFAGRVGRWVESHQLGQQPGLYKQSLVDTLSLTSAEEFEGDKPFLLFLHGTMSSFEGSFGDLWDPRNKAGEDARKELARGYGAAYAWQHYTLTESPIDNALALAKRLPKKAKLHLVTHSRGGLIGDLLCLGQRQENGEPLAAKPLDELFEIAVGVEGRDGGEKRKAAQALRKAQAQRLADLVQVLKKNEIQVERYVRVACPARGTTLASNRLDRWLSIFKLLGDLVSPLKLPLKLLLALIAEHDDPKTLPGLEAQMPGSPLIRLLNLPALTVRADLSVIAGDTEASGFVGRLKELALDQFFEDESDVIVNTGAMYGGLKRADGGRFHLDSGSEVSHFNYFENAKTVRMLASGLARSEGSDAGFRPLAEAKEKEPVRGLKLSRAPAGPCPAVFLLPGIMGSHLTVNGDRLWLDVGELMLGGFKRLKMGVAGVAAESLFEDFYGDLAQHLAETHEVIPFAYDWRGSILDAGRILGDRVSEKLDEIERAGTNQPVRILAHSMGGLVARAMIAERPEVWRRMTAHEGARLIMLGTPNGGSHEIVRLLTSRASTLEQLGLLDLRHSAKDLRDVICGYPGVLELLPTGNDYECYSEQYWSGLRQSDEDVLRYPWEPPGAVDLKKAHRTWQTIEKKGLDPTRTLYVAGCAPATPIAWREEREYDYESGRETWLTLVFEASRRGDGQVPWDTGIPAGVKTWYLEDVSHGDLPDHEPAFPAYLELLQTGTTMRLSPAPPTGARGAVVDGRFDLPPERLDTLPNARDIAASALGASRRRKRPGLRLPKVEISVRHGNLGYARYPVCVGHYLGDTIVSAEDYLDTVLDGRLRKRHDLGLYPGRLGTFEVFLNPDRYEKPGGAIVVGLGQVGELSPGGLQSGIAQAALAYALQVAECPDERFGGTEGVPRSARLTSLLVGTGAGGMTVRDSIEAILRGVASANRRLHEARVSTQVWIDAVEFVELWQDIAIQATSGLERALLDGALADQFVWKDRSLVEGHGGRRRIVFEELPNWWHRVEIVHDRKADELRFIALTDRARAEETLVAGQLRLADDFISQAIAETQHGRDISRTLFEMLLPNRLKESAPNQYDIVLVVDEVSGRYPWELLEDRWSASNKPLSVAGGMLRQFKTAEFRERPVSSIEDKAYVVGNPVLPPLTKDFPFTELAGAESEAAAVADCLERHGFIVARQIHTHARDILMGLHREGYRVLHMAGHGIHDFEVVVEPRSMHSSEGQAAAVPAEFCVACEQPLLPKKKRVSGMVIGQGVFLTPGDVEQMRWVPELVFINCCHLGRVDSGPTPARWQYHHFAANVAAQFMRMGVKAVVAAGWAVDDAAAEAFAVSFYTHLLEGDAFGVAVRAAREETFDRYGGTNTWGAYQCYGDPDYRLRARKERGETDKRVDYVSPAQVQVELENLASRARMGSGSTESLRKQLDSIAEHLSEKPTSWHKRSELASALGVAYGELGDFQQAIGYLDHALANDKCEISVRAVEQRANFKSRWAVTLATMGETPPGATKPQELIRDSIKELKALSEFAETAERSSLLGSAHKRRAMISKGPERKDALKCMAECYRKAHELRYDETTGEVKTYPLLNWLAAEVLLDWQGEKGRGALDELERWCKRAEAQAAEKEAVDPDFWNSAVKPECDLVRALASKTVDQTGQAIIEDYQRAKTRGVSQREFQSVLDHLQFLADVALGIAESEPQIREQAEVLKNIYDQLLGKPRK